MITLGVWALTSGLTLFVSAIAFADRPPEPEPPFRLQHLKLFRDVSAAPQSQPGVEIAGYAFPENQHVKHLRFQFGPGSAGQSVRVHILGAKTVLGLEKSVLEIESVIDAEGVLVLRLASSEDWPVGFYRVEFQHAGRAVGLSAYRVRAVQERTTDLRIRQIRVYGLENGKGVLRSQPSADDRYLEFHAATDGARTAGATVFWTLSYQSSPLATPIRLHQREITHWPLENTVLVHQAERATPWPAGTYRLEYLVDGVAIGSHSYEIT